MATKSLRREVLQSFKNIHRTRCCVFKDDLEALENARKQINESYKINKNESDEEKIKQLIQFALDVIHELKTNVVQFKLVQNGRYQAQLRPEIFMDPPKPTPKHEIRNKQAK